MKLFLAIGLLVFTHSAFALEDIDNANKWNYAIDFHGVQNQTGESIGFLSPHLGVLQLRLEIAEDDRRDTPSVSAVDFYSGHLAALIYQRTRPSSPVRPYIGIAYDLYFHATASGPTTGGCSFFPGIQIWQKLDPSFFTRSVGFFFEGGPSLSNFNDDTGAQHLADGFRIKLGVIGEF